MRSRWRRALKSMNMKGNESPSTEKRYPRPLSMITALDGGFSAVFYVGYHTAAGTTHGAFDHTYSGRAFAEIRINGVRVSEYIINSLCAGEYSVPVAYLAGDDYLKDEVEKYTPWVVFTPLKRGLF